MLRLASNAGQAFKVLLSLACVKCSWPPRRLACLYVRPRWRSSFRDEGFPFRVVPLVAGLFVIRRSACR